MLDRLFTILFISFTSFCCRNCFVASTIQPSGPPFEVEQTLLFLLRKKNYYSTVNSSIVCRYSRFNCVFETLLVVSPSLTTYIRLRFLPAPYIASHCDRYYLLHCSLICINASLTLYPIIIALQQYALHSIGDLKPTGLLFRSQYKEGSKRKCQARKENASSSQ